MKLKKVRKNMEKYFKSIDWRYDVDEEDKKITFKFPITFDEIGTPYCYFTFFESGMVLYHILFDKIEKSPAVYKYLSDYNEESFLLYATADDRLGLEHTVYIMQEDDVATYTSAIMDELVSDDNVELLKPLVALTSED